MDKPRDLRSLWLEGIERLKKAGSDSPRLDVDMILSYAFGVPRHASITDGSKIVDEEDAKRYVALILEREKRVPLAYILGDAEFYGLEFIVERGVLIPRPETEMLVERVLATIGSRPVKICDWGCGSGAISVAIAVNAGNARITALDKSPQAVRLAWKNALAHRVLDRIDIIHSDGFQMAPKGPFDVVVSNPPYIPSWELPSLMKEVLNEPIDALDGGDDGLFYLRSIAIGAYQRLIFGGSLVVEIGGDEQADALLGFLAHCGYKDIIVKKDLYGLTRMIVAKKPQNGL